MNNQSFSTLQSQIIINQSQAIDMVSVLRQICHRLENIGNTVERFAQDMKRELSQTIEIVEVNLDAIEHYQMSQQERKRRNLRHEEREWDPRVNRFFDEPQEIIRSSSLAIRSLAHFREQRQRPILESNNRQQNSRRVIQNRAPQRMMPPISQILSEELSRIERDIQNLIEDHAPAATKLERLKELIVELDAIMERAKAQKLERLVECIERVRATTFIHHRRLNRFQA